MEQFVEVITTFPAVVFTVLLLVSVGYWLVTTVLGLDGLDGDAELDLDGAADAAGLGGLATSLDLHLMPVSLVVTVISLVGWVVSVIASVVIGADGAVGVVIGIGILAVALAAGVAASGQVARLLHPLFSPARATAHGDLLGRLCVVRTGRVDAGFGQAEVVDGQGGSHLIQVRCAEQNELAAGDPALLVDVDDGVFVVTPDVGALGGAPPG